ncbi:MAG: AAA family ATPase, partial [Epsilonproteobacteria bacterium]|nr:AAA family ATPase [Campylobacterota bacterium]
MVERFYLKNHLSFKEADLRFDKNFIVFTGASGAGKSILFEAILALFGFKEAKASFSEAVIDSPLYLDRFLIEEDEPNIFKCIKEQKVRYFINNQSVSKKIVREISESFIKYLSLREAKELESDNLLRLIDRLVLKKDENYENLLAGFKRNFKEYQSVFKKLQEIEEEEKRVLELKEFAAFEIQKISQIDPKE